MKENSWQFAINISLPIYKPGTRKHVNYIIHNLQTSKDSTIVFKCPTLKMLFVVPQFIGSCTNQFCKSNHK